MLAGLVAINLAAVIFGTAALFGKLAVSPLWIVAARAAFAALALALLGAVRGTLAAPARASWGPLVCSGVLLAAHWLTFFVSVQRAGVAIATLTFATLPLFTLLLEGAARRRVPALPQLLASAVIMGAVSMLVRVGERSATLVGVLAGLASALTFAIFAMISKRLTGTVTSLTVSMVQTACVVAVTAPLLPLASQAPRSLSEWGWLLILGVVTTALMHQLYLFALTRLLASTCNAFVALEPVYAVAFSTLWFGDRLTPTLVVSGVSILAASLLLLRYEPRS